MDRTKAGITKSQPGFFNVVAIPLFSALASVLPDCSPMLQVRPGGLTRNSLCEIIRKTAVPPV